MNTSAQGLSGPGPEQPDPARPVRKRLFHTLPAWVADGSTFFLTFCCAQRGGNQLNRPEEFAIMTLAVAHYVRSDRWWVELFLAMPDHVHALIAFPRQETMAGVVRDWKRYVAKRAGVQWQDGFFDHRLRSAESGSEKWHYITQNPVRKGLCGRAEDWPWVWKPR